MRCFHSTGLSKQLAEPAKINRYIELIETLVSRSKQRPLPQINRKLSCTACPNAVRKMDVVRRSNDSRVSRARLVFPTPHTQNPTPRPRLVRETVAEIQSIVHPEAKFELVRQRP